MINKITSHPWERRKGESSTAYGYFSAYRDMSTGREMSKITSIYKVRESTLIRYAEKYGWKERAGAYDAFHEILYRKRYENESATLRNEQLEVISNLKETLLKPVQILAEKIKHDPEALAEMEGWPVDKLYSFLSSNKKNIQDLIDLENKLLASSKTENESSSPATNIETINIQINNEKAPKILDILAEAGAIPPPQD